MAEGYWKDIGTPERYLEATFDILEGSVGTEVAERMGTGYLCVERGVEAEGRIVPAALVEAGCQIADGARVGGRAVLEHGVVGRRGHDDRGRGGHARHRDRRQLHAARLHHRRRRADRRRLRDRRMSVLGEGVTLGAGNTVSNGARLFPGVEPPGRGAL